jgi:hypothetical protein
MRTRADAQPWTQPSSLQTAVAKVRVTSGVLRMQRRLQHRQVRLSCGTISRSRKNNCSSPPRSASSRHSRRRSSSSSAHLPEHARLQDRLQGDPSRHLMLTRLFPELRHWQHRRRLPHMQQRRFCWLMAMERRGRLLRLMEILLVTTSIQLLLKRASFPSAHKAPSCRQLRSSPKRLVLAQARVAPAA